MTATVAADLIRLFDHLGIDAAHIAAGGLVPADWLGLAIDHPQRVASLTVISPPGMDARALRAVGERLLAVSGDRGVAAERVRQFLTGLPEAGTVSLQGYAYLPWSDVMAERGEEIAVAMLGRIGRAGAAHPARPLSLPEQEGEFAGISYRVQGEGPPLVLMPLDIAPSQWEPLIPALGGRFSTIVLGGPALGIVALLEGRGRGGYGRVARALLDAVRVRPGDVVFEIGCGSGVIVRELARRSAGANRIIGMDQNRYLLGEARKLAARHGLADAIAFEEGRAEAIPMADGSVDVALSCTVMEEGDADLMLRELVRVTKPGGRVGVIVRADRDMASWINLPLGAALRAKFAEPGLLGSPVAEAGCGDASLYRRFREAGLTDLAFFPQLAAVNPQLEAAQLARFEQQIIAVLTPEEAQEWRAAVAPAKADGTFFIAKPHHCAVGTKPV